MLHLSRSSSTAVKCGNSRMLTSNSRTQRARPRRCQATSAVLADPPTKLPKASQSNSVAIQAATVDDGLYTVHGRLTTSASPALVYSILTDYESGSRIFSSIQDCQVLDTAEGKELLQSCGWKFFAFSGTFQTRLQVHEDPQLGTLVFSISQSDFMREFEGRWQVSLGRNGVCHVDHTLSVRLSIPMPAMAAKYTKTIFCAQVTTVLEELSAELTRI